MGLISVITIIVPIISLAVSVISLVLSIRSYSMQNRINKIELQLKEHDLNKIKIEEQHSTETCVEARIIDVGNKKHKLRVWNSGNCPVYEVCAVLSDEAPVIVTEKDMMPFEILEPKKCFDVPVIKYYGTSRKFEITTKWKDEEGKEYAKTQMGFI